jgi:hypothetical protein
MMAKREVWFRNLFRFAPWSIIPIHWKGWATLILGPLFLVIVGNALADRPTVLMFLIPGGVLALFVAVYTHTTWEKG